MMIKARKLLQATKENKLWTAIIVHLLNDRLHKRNNIQSSAHYKEIIKTLAFCYIATIVNLSLTKYHANLTQPQTKGNLIYI